jgi:hypothetical protein
LYYPIEKNVPIKEFYWIVVQRAMRGILGIQLFHADKISKTHATQQDSQGASGTYRIAIVKFVIGTGA